MAEMVDEASVEVVNIAGMLVAVGVVEVTELVEEVVGTPVKLLRAIAQS
jgi:hypothetical protein